MSLTFRRNINIHMFRDEFVVKKGFLTSAVHIPKQSLMIHESLNSRIVLSTVIFSTVVISLPMT